MKRERFEQRLMRIFARAGYSASRILTVTPEEMVEIPDITVPNIRAVLYVQNRVRAEQNKARQAELIDILLRDLEKGGMGVVSSSGAGCTRFTQPRGRESKERG